MDLACNLYWTALAEDPSFAPAWAWLGRCCSFLDKFSSGSKGYADLAHAALERAFALDPDLAAAHQFYTFIEADTGRAPQAISRLLHRLHSHPAEPETFSGLVQVLRFRGLLHQSIQAHQRAVELDPSIDTSVAHSYFLATEYPSAIESYKGRGSYYLDAAAWAMLGEKKRAIELLRERLNTMSLSNLLRALLGSLLAMLQNEFNEAMRLMAGADTTREPEILVYFARHYAHLGRAALAVRSLRQASQAGFVCPPETLQTDPWLSSLRKQRGFSALLVEAQSMVSEAESTFAANLPKSVRWPTN
jgi:tetratricopeptide (TPR) repeat protein